MQSLINIPYPFVKNIWMIKTQDFELTKVMLQIDLKMKLKWLSKATMMIKMDFIPISISMAWPKDNDDMFD